MLTVRPSNTNPTQVADQLEKGNLKQPPPGWIRPGDIAEKDAAGDGSNSSGERGSANSAVTRLLQCKPVPSTAAAVLPCVLSAWLPRLPPAAAACCHQMRMMTRATRRTSLATSPSTTTATRTWLMPRQVRGGFMVAGRCWDEKPACSGFPWCP